MKPEKWVTPIFNLHQISGTRTLDEIKYLFEHLSKTAKSENKNDKVRPNITLLIILSP